VERVRVASTAEACAEVGSTADAAAAFMAADIAVADGAWAAEAAEAGAAPTYG
jgi:hypothetical protein